MSHIDDSSRAVKTPWTLWVRWGCWIFSSWGAVLTNRRLESHWVSLTKCATRTMNRNVRMNLWCKASVYVTSSPAQFWCGALRWNFHYPKVSWRQNTREDNFACVKQTSVVAKTVQSECMETWNQKGPKIYRLPLEKIATTNIYQRDSMGPLSLRNDERKCQYVNILSRSTLLLQWAPTTFGGIIRVWRRW